MLKLPLVGPAYKMQAQSMSCQNCINWYPRTIEHPNGARVAALMPTPGLKKIFEGGKAAVRCLYVLSNGALLAVIGKQLYHSVASKFELKPIGEISALGTVRVADNGQKALLVNGTYTYVLDLVSLQLSRLSGSNIQRSTHVQFLDGRFVVNKIGAGQFYWSDLYSDNFDALAYATAESTPDNITAIVAFNRELWLFGAQSVERYYGTGSANAPFSRLSGGAMAFGCVAPDSIVTLATGVIWLGVSAFGGNQIVMSAGGVPERISTHAIEEAIAIYSNTADAMAYAYQQEGHVFYVISFPSANVTFCFDVATGLWHQRSFANAQGLHERHRAQHHAFFRNMHIVGDYRNGKLYDLDNQTFTDDGELILRERTAQAVNTEGALARFNKLEIVCETGFALEKVVSDDFEYEGEFPMANAVIAFKVKNFDSTIRVLINGQRVEGPLAFVMDTLAQQYQVYMSFVYPDILLFTKGSTMFCDIVIKGVESYIENLGENYDIPFGDLDYCECFKEGDLFVFSMIRRRMGFFTLIDIDMELNDTIPVIYANSAADAEQNNAILTSVHLDRWFENQYVEIFEDTRIDFTKLPDVPFSWVIEHKDEVPEYGYYYFTVVNHSFAKALAMYKEDDLSNRIYYSSNRGYFFASEPYYMDLTQKATRGFAKGYSPYLEIPS